MAPWVLHQVKCVEAGNRQLGVHPLLGGRLPSQARTWGPDTAGAVREALGSLTGTVPEAWEDNVLTWAAAWGALALRKRHFGLAIEVGRQGQGQARQRRKSLVDKWLSPPHTCPPSCWSPVEKLHHCSFSSKSHRQDKQPNAQTCLRLTCFHKEID